MSAMTLDLQTMLTILNVLFLLECEHMNCLPYSWQQKNMKGLDNANK